MLARHLAKNLSPLTKVRIDYFLERLGLRLRTSASFPLLTTPLLHRPALERLGAGADGEGATFLDVGAHVGTTALALARAFPKARIHAFEPVSAIYEQLVQNCRRFPRVACHRIALGNETAERRIALVSNELACTMNQISREADPETPSHLTETIRITRLDDFCQAHGIGDIALLKSDTEGFELEVLKGGLTTLRRGLVQNIIVEVSFWKTNPQHVHYDGVATLLEPLGFELAGFYEPGYSERTGRMWYTNAFFTRK